MIWVYASQSASANNLEANLSLNWITESDTWTLYSVYAFFSLVTTSKSCNCPCKRVSPSWMIYASTVL